MIIDHIALAVADYERSKRFYLQCLAPLGLELVAEIDNWAGFGRDGKGEFWFGEGETARSPMHIAFAAEDRACVDRFHRAGLAAGAIDNGAPGLRPVYHDHYYGAFLIDPDGHNIEAVCRRPE